MKIPLSRTLSAVPQTLHAHLEIAKAIHVLAAESEAEQLLKRVELAARTQARELIAQVVHDVLNDLRKAGFNPNEPRVPAGSPAGGQWTNGTGDRASSAAPVISDANTIWRPGAQYAANDLPGIGHNQGPPLDEPPKIPPQPPAKVQVLNMFIKAAAYWLAIAGIGAAKKFLKVLGRVYWLTQRLADIYSYLEPPKTLEELQRDALSPKSGYQIHRIVERTPARKDGFPKDMIEAPENLVRIPTLRHWQISGWYGRGNDEFDELSPREYLRGKSWEERRRIGLDAMIKFGVLKP